MSINTAQYSKILEQLDGRASLVAVSKMQPMAAIRALYDLGQRDFGENYVQELLEKQATLPKDIRWHFIGHLQRNKVKYIAPFVHLIHGVDSEKLLEEINKQGKKLNRVIPCLLQVFISKEETKFGFDEKELLDLVQRIKTGESKFDHTSIKGLMGMASFTEDNDLIKKEFSYLRSLFDKIAEEKLSADFTILSMGMSADYQFGLENGSTMVRIGSLVFGSRFYSK